MPLELLKQFSPENLFPKHGFPLKTFYQPGVSPENFFLLGPNFVFEILLTTPRSNQPGSNQPASQKELSLWTPKNFGHITNNTRVQPTRVQSTSLTKRAFPLDPNFFLTYYQQDKGRIPSVNQFKFIWCNQLKKIIIINLLKKFCFTPHRCFRGWHRGIGG